MPGPALSIVAAVARDGGIGRDGGLLVRIPEDLRRFKALTLGAPIVMGRRTWESIGRPLPGRRSLVLSRDAAWSAVGAERAASLEAALALAADAPRVFVIGGAAVYAEALPSADTLELTEIDATFPADTFFPPWDREAFAADCGPEASTADRLRYRFCTWRRRRGGDAGDASA